MKTSMRNQVPRQPISQVEEFSVLQIGQRHHVTPRALAALAKNTRCVTAASVKAGLKI
jgi:hypothetical protein